MYLNFKENRSFCKEECRRIERNQFQYVSFNLIYYLI